MTDLDPSLLSYFSKDTFNTSEALDRAFGIDTLIPGTIIDSHLFEPCGYSVNGIIKVFLSHWHFVVYLSFCCLSFRMIFISLFT